MFYTASRNEWFYRRIHPGYFVVPPYMEGCTPPEEYKIMEIPLSP
jgi:hypothetical protein